LTMKEKGLPKRQETGGGGGRNQIKKKIKN
jgi:hypothetical protein